MCSNRGSELLQLQLEGSRGGAGNSGKAGAVLDMCPVLPMGWPALLSLQAVYLHMHSCTYAPNLP